MNSCRCISARARIGYKLQWSLSSSHYPGQLHWSPREALQCPWSWTLWGWLHKKCSYLKQKIWKLRFVDNFSSGARGSASAEYFLKQVGREFALYCKVKASKQYKDAQSWYMLMIDRDGPWCSYFAQIQIQTQTQIYSKLICKWLLIGMGCGVLVPLRQPPTFRSAPSPFLTSVCTSRTTNFLLLILPASPTWAWVFEASASGEGGQIEIVSVTSPNPFPGECQQW